MANLITTLRFFLLLVVVWAAYQAPPHWQILNPLLLIIVFAMDGLDGYVARKRGEASLFGSIFDIAVDRIVENTLWIVLVDLDLVPVWVALVFITRGFLVDSIRGHGASQGQTPFGMMRTPLGRFLVAGRFMRFTYGLSKMLVFTWAFLVLPWPALHPDSWTEWHAVSGLVLNGLIYAAVILCLARGLPVIIEFTLREGPRTARGS